MMSFRKYLQESLEHGQEIKHAHPGMKDITYTIKKHGNHAYDIIDEDGNVATTIYSDSPEQARDMAKKEGYNV